MSYDIEQVRGRPLATVHSVVRHVVRHENDVMYDIRGGSQNRKSCRADDLLGHESHVLRHGYDVVTMSYDMTWWSPGRLPNVVSHVVRHEYDVVHDFQKS